MARFCEPASLTYNPLQVASHLRRPCGVWVIWRHPRAPLRGMSSPSRAEGATPAYEAGPHQRSRLRPPPGAPQSGEPESWRSGSIRSQ